MRHSLRKRAFARYLTLACLMLPDACLLLPASALASGEKGNGGAVHVCRDPRTRAIRSIELVDLYRARQERGTRLAPLSGSPEAHAAQAARRLTGISLYLYDQIARELSELNARRRTGPSGIPLLDTEDWRDETDALRAQPGCGFEQLAIFTPGGSLVVQPDLFAALDPLNRAAFRLHEALYRVMRTDVPLLNPNSVKSQRIVADLLDPSATAGRISTDLVQAVGQLDRWGIQRPSFLGCGTYDPEPISDAAGPIVIETVANEHQMRNTAWNDSWLTLLLSGQSGPENEIILLDRLQEVMNRRVSAPFPASALRGARLTLRGPFLPSYNRNSERIPNPGYAFELRAWQGERLIARVGNAECANGSAGLGRHKEQVSLTLR